MDVVLTKDVPNLGRKGEVKAVKSGYFRNFLAPRGKAIRVTPKLMQQILEQRLGREKRREEMLTKAEDLAKRIEGMTLTFKQKATPKGKLYASISELKIQHELEKHLEFDLDKEMIILEGPIKEVGESTATIKLTEAVSTELKIVVEAEK
jgi:large subunit ribosomal protein L9